MQIIASIKNRTFDFHTYAGGKTAWLVVRKGVKSEYVQTEADGKLTNNLLSLPEC